MTPMRANVLNVIVFAAAAGLLGWVLPTGQDLEAQMAMVVLPPQP